MASDVSNFLTQTLDNISTQHFSEVEISGAQDLLYRIVYDTSFLKENNAIDNYKVRDSDLWRKYSHALSSQLSFYFPKNRCGNYTTSVTKGLDTPVINKRGDSFGFHLVCRDSETQKIIEKNKIYFNDLLYTNFKVLKPLPTWLEIFDVFSIEVNPRAAPQGLTVKQLVQELFLQGFEYFVPENKECLFQDLLQAQIQIDSEKSLLDKNIKTVQAQEKIIKFKV